MICLFASIDRHKQKSFCGLHSVAKDDNKLIYLPFVKQLQKHLLQLILLHVMLFTEHHVGTLQAKSTHNSAQRNTITVTNAQRQSLISITDNNKSHQCQTNSRKIMQILSEVKTDDNYLEQLNARKCFFQVDTQVSPPPNMCAWLSRLCTLEKHHAWNVHSYHPMEFKCLTSSH